MGRKCFHCLAGPHRPGQVCSPLMRGVMSKGRGDDVETDIEGDVIFIEDTLINSGVSLGGLSLKETFRKVVKHGISVRI